MSKIFIVGASPLPIDSASTLYGLGHRTWHFTKPLMDNGHEIKLITIRIPSAKEASLDVPDVIKQTHGKLEYHIINEPGLFQDMSYLQEQYDNFQPDCIIGVNTYPASYAAKIQSTKPFWADLNGSLMTEAQAKANIKKDNKPIAEFWEQELACLIRGDVFSTVSIPQKYMLLGELATIGRLNQYTVGYEFAYPVPNSLENKEIVKKKGNLLRGVKIDSTDFVVLWSGGYNTWTDVDTLFDGIIQAMDKNPKIKYVSTGGSLASHDESTYQTYLEKINKSRFKDRFIMLGWVASEDVFEYYFEGDIGINIDSFNYETLIGARNRLIHMMKTGLPVITTLGTEISRIIEKNQIGLTFQIGNPLELSEKLLYAVEHKDEMKKIGMLGKQYVYDHFTYEKTTMKIQEWVKDPWRASDWKKNILLSKEDKNNPPLTGKPMQDMIRYFKNQFGKSSE